MNLKKSIADTSAYVRDVATKPTVFSSKKVNGTCGALASSYDQFFRILKVKNPNDLR